MGRLTSDERITNKGQNKVDGPALSPCRARAPSPSSISICSHFLRGFSGFSIRLFIDRSNLGSAICILHPALASDRVHICNRPARTLSSFDDTPLSLFFLRLRIAAVHTIKRICPFHARTPRISNLHCRILAYCSIVLYPHGPASHMHSPVKVHLHQRLGAYQCHACTSSGPRQLNSDSSNSPRPV